MEWTLNKSEKVYSLMPASLHQSVPKTKQRKYFFFVGSIQKKNRQSGLFFSNWDKKNKKKTILMFWVWVFGHKLM